MSVLQGHRQTGLSRIWRPQRRQLGLPTLRLLQQLRGMRALSWEHSVPHGDVPMKLSEQLNAMVARGATDIYGTFQGHTLHLFQGHDETFEVFLSETGTDAYRHRGHEWYYKYGENPEHLDRPIDARIPNDGLDLIKWDPPFTTQRAHTLNPETQLTEDRMILAAMLEGEYVGVVAGLGQKIVALAYFRGHGHGECYLYLTTEAYRIAVFEEMNIDFGRLVDRIVQKESMRAHEPEELDVLLDAFTAMGIEAPKDQDSLLDAQNQLFEGLLQLNNVPTEGQFYVAPYINAGHPLGIKANMEVAELLGVYTRELFGDQPYYKQVLERINQE